MTGIPHTLAIAGAAEGSYYLAGGVSTDVRYQPKFANAKSGLSFGTFQFDVSTNPQGRAGFADVLRQGVLAGTIDRATSDRLMKSAASKNAEAYMTKGDIPLITALMQTAAAKRTIDTLDLGRAMTVAAMVDGMIAQAATVWANKKVAASAILTQGQSGNLNLFAYILACLNRYPKDTAVVQRWLQGESVKTLNGPSGGFQLTAPPTIQQMHDFFHSLRIWDGTQGSYANLRARLDPTLARISG